MRQHNRNRLGVGHRISKSGIASSTSQAASAAEVVCTGLRDSHSDGGVGTPDPCPNLMEFLADPTYAGL